MSPELRGLPVSLQTENLSTNKIIVDSNSAWTILIRCILLASLVRAGSAS